MALSTSGIAIVVACVVWGVCGLTALIIYLVRLARNRREEEKCARNLSAMTQQLATAQSQLQQAEEARRQQRAQQREAEEAERPLPEVRDLLGDPVRLPIHGSGRTLHSSSGGPIPVIVVPPPAALQRASRPEAFNEHRSTTAPSGAATGPFPAGHRLGTAGRLDGTTVRPATFVVGATTAGAGRGRLSDYYDDACAPRKPPNTTGTPAVGVEAAVVGDGALRPHVGTLGMVENGTVAIPVPAHLIPPSPVGSVRSDAQRVPQPYTPMPSGGGGAAGTASASGNVVTMANPLRRKGSSPSLHATEEQRASVTVKRPPLLTFKKAARKVVGRSASPQSRSTSTHSEHDDGNGEGDRAGSGRPGRQASPAPMTAAAGEGKKAARRHGGGQPPRLTITEDLLAANELAAPEGDAPPQRVRRQGETSGAPSRPAPGPRGVGSRPGGPPAAAGEKADRAATAEVTNPRASGANVGGGDDASSVHTTPARESTSEEEGRGSPVEPSLTKPPRNEVGSVAPAGAAGGSVAIAARAPGGAAGPRAGPGIPTRGSAPLEAWHVIPFDPPPLPMPPSSTSRNRNSSRVRQPQYSHMAPSRVAHNVNHTPATPRSADAVTNGTMGSAEAQNELTRLRRALGAQEAHHSAFTADRYQQNSSQEDDEMRSAEAMMETGGAAALNGTEIEEAFETAFDYSRGTRAASDDQSEEGPSPYSWSWV